MVTRVYKRFLFFLFLFFLMFVLFLFFDGIHPCTIKNYFGEDSKRRYTKLVTRVEPHASTVNLLKRAENSAM